MEHLPVLAISFLSVIAIILIVVRIRLAMRKDPGSDYSAGKSMTIGGREVQEDNCAVLETTAGIMAVLADGMGRQYGGRVSSRIAVECFTDIFQDFHAFDNPQYFFRKSFNATNRRILNTIDEGSGAASVSAVLVRDLRLYYAVVGNVRVAVYRGGDLIPVSEGHTVDVLARQKYREGQLTKQKAVALLEYHRLYNYVGQDEFRDMEIFDKPQRLKKGDIVTLMSDGLYDLASWRDMEEILRRGQDCQQMAFDLIELVNRSPGHNKDNASVVLIRV